MNHELAHPRRSPRVKSRRLVRWAAALALAAVPLAGALVAPAGHAAPVAPASPTAATPTPTLSPANPAAKPIAKPADPTAEWPKAAAGWKAELLAAKPDLHHPSVVTCAPDGRIFVAEDYMDMEGPSNKPGDRILCLHPDGHRTVFAEGLNAVFGLAYIDGKLYVHHVPKFSVFTDDQGVAKDRRDLIDCTNPTPAPGFNDHIPANIRLGMDGFLYLATGDKGVFGAESNVDHRKAEIHGGGVLRIRPDGTDMEVFSTGTRNHLDVALNAEDEIFTLDNTDDGLGWWTRMTHMVDGGYYGYPYDYRPAKDDAEGLARWNADKDKARPWQPYTLWRLADTGGGSATGAVGYNEEALPEEYHGNLFMCEWGKGELERWVVRREGGTYKLVLRDDKFFKPDKAKEPFRPVGVTVLPDGSGLLVTDWNYSGWMSKTDAGRLFKLTFTGPLHSVPRPAWFVPAAQGQPFTATTEELAAGLRHPAQGVRLVAQRRLADRGAAAVAAVVAVLQDPSAPPSAKWSAIWTLDRMQGAGGAGGSAVGRLEILAALRDEKQDVSVRRQAARQLGTRRAREAIPALVGALTHDDASLRFQAATALGRVGDRQVVPQLLDRLSDPDLFARYAVFTALSRVGRADPAAWPAIVDGLSGHSPATREGTVFALRNQYDEALVTALARFIADSRRPAEGRAAAVRAVAPLHKQFKPWDGKWWGTQPAGGHWPAREVEWAGTAPVASALRQALEDSDPLVRRAAVEGLQVAPDPDAAEALLAFFRADPAPASRRAALRALAAAKSESAGPLVVDLLSHATENAELLGDAVKVAETIGGPKMAEALTTVAAGPIAGEGLVRVIEAVGQSHDGRAVPVLGRRLADADNKVAAAAATALGAISGDDSVAALVGGLDDRRAEVRKASAAALAVALATAPPKGAAKPKPTPHATNEGKPNSGGPGAAPRSPLPVLHPEAAIEPLLAAARSPDTEREAVSALCVVPDLRALDAYLIGLGSKDGSVRDKSRKAMAAIREEALPLIEARLETNPPPAVAIDELQKLYTAASPILNWSILGPFPNPTPEPFDVANPPVDSAAATQFKGVDGQPLKWIKVQADRKQGRVDLVPRMNPHDNVTAYAVATFEADAAREATFAAGADDGMALWLNGRKIFEDLQDHGWTPGQFTAKGTTRKGRNVLVAKITQHGGPWEFSVATGNERKGKLFTFDTRNLAPEVYARYADAHPHGSPEAGRKIFENLSGVACARCHKVGNDGGDIGPSLNGVGTKYKRPFLIESVLYPSKQILDGFQQTVIRTKAGRVEYGIVKEETESQVTLVDSGGQKLVLKKSEIVTRKVSNVSLMPEGLHTAMKPEEFVDLIAYLESLKEKPAEVKK